MRWKVIVYHNNGDISVAEFHDKEEAVNAYKYYKEDKFVERVNLVEVHREYIR